MRAALAVALLLTACGTDSPPLTDATSLSCPSPGRLPFRLMSSGFQRPENKTLATNDPRVKDEASDTLGNPGGPYATVYIADAEMPSMTPIDYHGAKARTSHSGGLFAQPLPGEYVSLWQYDGAAWQSAGRTQTGDDGYYDLPSTNVIVPNDQPMYSILEADGTCAEHFDYLLPTGTKVVVTDIDGTLTTADEELYKQLGDDTYTPAMITSANTMMQTWRSKGYTIVYLTARPHVFRTETRGWLHELMFPNGPLITAAAVESAQPYKTLWLQRMMTTFGWVPVAAYGNADTDIGAYEAVGIPKDHTFIVGPLAGQGGTVGIDNLDYTSHITTFVDAQPDNN